MFNSVDKSSRRRTMSSPVSVKVVTSELEEAYYDDEVLSVEDLISLLSSSDFSNFDIFCIAKAGGDLIPSLCVRSHESSYQVFESQRSLQDTLKSLGLLKSNGSFCTNDDWFLKEDKDVCLLFRKMKLTNRSSQDAAYPFTKKEDASLNALVECCQVVRNASLNIENLAYDRLADKLNAFKQYLRDHPEVLSVDIASFVRTVERIDAELLELSPTGTLVIPDTIRQRLGTGFQEAPFKRLLESAQKTGKPLAGQFKVHVGVCYFVLIPVTRRADHAKFTRQILLVHSKSRISQQQIKNIQEYLDYFVTYRLVNAKLRSLTSLQQEVLSTDYTSIQSFQDLESLYRSFCKKCMAAILESTYADSVTLRIYEPSSGTLALFEEASNLFGRRGNGSVSSIAQLKMNDFKFEVKKPHRSVNCFTFRFCGHGEYVHIKNLLDKIPSQYTKLGLHQSLPVRNSLTEICFPLFAGKTPYGTLNIESSFRDAFDEDDVEFLKSIRTALESFYNFSFKFNDAKWLAGRSPVYWNFHELKQIMSRTKTFSDEQIKLLNRLVVINSSPNEADSVQLSSLSALLTKWLRSISNRASFQYVKNVLVLDLQDDVFVGAEAFDRVSLVCKSLLENIYDYGDIKKDKLIMRSVASSTNPQAKILHIWVKTYGPFNEEDLQYLTLVPFWRDGEQHYGMFLIGVVARSMGGSVFMSRDPLLPFSTLEILIPLENGFN